MATQPRGKFHPSALWQHLQQDIFARASTINLDIFRKPGTLNNRLSSWDPEARNHRYYKTILFNTSQGMPDRFFELYGKLDTSVGSPITVKVRGLSIDLDYLLSIHEVLFIEKSFAQPTSICEVGAGFGRTCHALLINQPQILQYTVIDLPECLALSERYLRRVLPAERFEKIQFVAVEQASNVGAHDLFMNINSMAEMDEEVIRSYFNLIDQKGQWFYTKNTVGKYRPESVGITEYNPKELGAALASGVLTEIIDIFDDRELAEARLRYEARMSPAARWRLVDSAQALPWSYYQHSIYRKTE